MTAEIIDLIDVILTFGALISPYIFYIINNINKKRKLIKKGICPVCEKSNTFFKRKDKKFLCDNSLENGYACTNKYTIIEKWLIDKIWYSDLNAE
jgi:hypothetical protein